MTGLDHETSAAVDEAVAWLIQTPAQARPQRALVPLLREMFGLTAAEACAAIREHRLQLARAT